jgi:rhodanese-related sulfurtransferase
MKKFLLPLLACFAFVTAALAADAAAPAKIADISLPELKAAIAAGKVALIDVNGTASYAAGHIPGAIDFAVNKDKLASALPADKSTLVVAYCGNERCGAYKSGANAALALGFTHVKHFAPGIAGWKKAGEPTEAAK